MAFAFPNAETIFDAPMRLVMNIAVGGWFTGVDYVDASLWYFC